MSLRPRYSLLTMLLLTAAIAVGIKLWRGPHRVMMSNRPTLEEQAILERATMAAVHAESFKPLRYEYDFVRSGQGKDCLTVVGRPTGSVPILIIPTSVTMQFALERSMLTPKDTANFLKNPTVERLICFVHSGRTQPSPFAATLTAASGQVTTAKHPTYYISSQKRVYVDAIQLAYGIYIRLIELNDIQDPAVRARVDEALASIPALK
jgi:hypothetical protein